MFTTKKNRTHLGRGAYLRNSIAFFLGFEKLLIRPSYGNLNKRERFFVTSFLEKHANKIDFSSFKMYFGYKAFVLLFILVLFLIVVRGEISNNTILVFMMFPLLAVFFLPSLKRKAFKERHLHVCSQVEPFLKMAYPNISLRFLGQEKKFLPQNVQASFPWQRKTRNSPFFDDFKYYLPYASNSVHGEFSLGEAKYKVHSADYMLNFSGASSRHKDIKEFTFIHFTLPFDLGMKPLFITSDMQTSFSEVFFSVWRNFWRVIVLLALGLELLLVLFFTRFYVESPLTPLLILCGPFIGVFLFFWIFFFIQKARSERGREKLDHLAFEDIFDVYTEDQLSLRTFLTPKMMQNLVDFSSNLPHGHTCEIYLQGANIYIAIPKRNLTIGSFDLVWTVDDFFAAAYSELKNILSLFYYLNIAYHQNLSSKFLEVPINTGPFPSKNSDK